MSQGLDLSMCEFGDPSPWAGKLPGGEPILLENAQWHVVVIGGAMESGLPSVALRLDLPGGGCIVAECSLALWSSVTVAARARYPEAFFGGPIDPRKPDPTPGRN